MGWLKRTRGAAPRPWLFWLVGSVIAVATFNVGCNSRSDTTMGTSSTVLPQQHDGDADNHTPTPPIADTPAPPNTPGIPTPNAPEPDGISAPIADIQADTDRNGVIDAEDTRLEDKWSPARGAVLIANVDDDDSNQRLDSADNVVNGDNDALDMAPLRLKHTLNLRDDAHTLTLTVNNQQAADRIRIFVDHGTGTRDILLKPEESMVNIPTAWLRSGDVQLWIEAIEGRSPAWDGTMSINLTISTRGQFIAADAVAMRVGPTIFPDNMQPPERLYVMKIEDPLGAPNLPFYNLLHDHLPDGVALVTADEQTYAGDRWLQDNMQIGYQEWPHGTGRTRMVTYLQLARTTGTDGLEHMVPDELLGPDAGYFAPWATHDTSLNYGGNLEIAPPHSTPLVNYPYGRVVVGGGDNGTILGARHRDHMGSEQRRWIDAQDMQGPSFEVSSQWLAVGHIDEIFLFIPDHNANSTRPWKVVMASPSMAIHGLRQLAQSGKGNRVVFSGRSTATTVNSILRDSDILAYNQAVQTRIDGVQAILEDELNLTEADFIPVPVMYEYGMYNGLDLGVSYNPGMQNLTVLGDTLFIPDPEGPRDNTADANSDIWRTATVQALQPLGLHVSFVDVFESYHELMGEAHCGTNVLAHSYNTPWWTP